MKKIFIFAVAIILATANPWQLGGQTICMKDTDNDGYRPNATATVNSSDADCDDPGEATSTDPIGDCADTDPARFPGNPEICDGKDNDCVNGVPYNEADADNDTYRVCAGDCNDNNANIHPNATEIVCNQIDDNCVGGIDEGTDVTPPVANCKTSVTVALPGGAATLSAATVNNGSTDACSGTNLSFSIVSGTTSYTCASIAASPLAVTLQVADAAGNTNTCASSVMVVDVLTYSETGRRVAGDGLAGEKFGWGVTVGSSVAGSGAPEAKVGTQNKQGAAYLFNGAGFGTQFKKLTATGGAAIDYFGNALALDGTTLLAGAYGDNVGTNTDQGSAYVFTSANSWAQVAQLFASDGAAYDYFGNAVALKNGIALVGANKAKVNNLSAQGAAYIFNGSNAWAQVTKLTASDGAANNYFGNSVSLNTAGTLALVGANGNLSNRGAAYIFNGSNAWAQVTKLTASDGAVGDWFGASVSLSGDGTYALIGAPSKASYKGAAYVFKNTGTWSQLKKLTASDGVANDRFGSSVALSGDYAYVSAIQNGTKGAVYVFSKNQGGTDNWGQIGKVVASDGALNDQYGFSLAVSGTNMVVGANLDDNTSPARVDQGSMYVFGGAVSCPTPPGQEDETSGTAQPNNQPGPQVRCSPNPFKDELVIEVLANGASHLQVSDVAGRVVSEVDLLAGNVKFEMKTGDWHPGMYFVQVGTESGVRVMPVALLR